MKKSLAILALLLLTSCTEAEQETVVIEINDHPKYETLRQENDRLQSDYKDLEKQAVALEIELQVAHEDIALLKNDRNVGVFELSAYSPYDDQNGLSSDGNPNMTRTGTKPGPGTMAVDPNVIPLGSRIVVIYEDGTMEHGRAEDTGGAIKNKKLDVFRETFDEAMAFGRQRAIVLWFEEE